MQEKLPNFTRDLDFIIQFQTNGNDFYPSLLQKQTLRNHSCFHNAKPFHPYPSLRYSCFFQIQAAYYASIIVKNHQKALRCVLLFRVAAFRRSTALKQCSSSYREFTVELALAHSFQCKQTNTETEI